MYVYTNTNTNTSMFSSSSGSVPAPGTLQVGIVSSQRLPPDPFNWMRYHVDVGISAFYIVFEETPDVPEGMAEYAAQLTAALGRRILFYWERRDVDRAREDNYMDLMTRQRQWVDRMVAKARSDGVAWLFHVDDDELLYPGDTSKDAISTWPEVLAAVPPSCASVHVDNWEAFSPESPASSWITDGGVRFLPQSCAGLFSAYGNGKGGTRTLAGQKSFGPHRFTGGKDCALAPTQGIVAHFEALAMGPGDVPSARWVEKNRLRLKDNLDNIPFIAARDSIAAVRTGDAQRMADTWAKYRSVTGERFQACSMPMQLTLPSHTYGT